MPGRYVLLLFLSAVLCAYLIARGVGLAAFLLTPLAVPAYIRLHGLPWRRMT